jgi:hypothetical protein
MDDLTKDLQGHSSVVMFPLHNFRSDVERAEISSNLFLRRLTSEERAWLDDVYGGAGFGLEGSTSGHRFLESRSRATL